MQKIEELVKAKADLLNKPDEKQALEHAIIKSVQTSEALHEQIRERRVRSIRLILQGNAACRSPSRPSRSMVLLRQLVSMLLPMQHASWACRTTHIIKRRHTTRHFLHSTSTHLAPPL